MLIIQSILAIVQGVLAVSLIGLILLQQGSGADAGVAFGSGSSSTMFGARGAGNLLTRLTAILAALFVINCLALAFVYKRQLQQESLLLTQPAVEADEITDDIPAMPADGDGAPTATGDGADDRPVMPLEITPAASGADAVAGEAETTMTGDGDTAATGDGDDTVPSLPDAGGGGDGEDTR